MLYDELAEGAAEVEGLEDRVGVAKQEHISDGGKWEEREADQVLPNYEKK